MEPAKYCADTRSLLFVPGHRPERFVKAVQSGADAVVLDLEDAVSASEKSIARENIDRWLGSGGPGIVRINGTGSPWYEDDVAMVGARQCAVILPKLRGPEEVAGLMGALAHGSCVMPLLETAAGILEARQVCAVPGVERAIFGNADLALELEIDHCDRDALMHARCHVVLASAACELAPPVDGVTSALDDSDTLVADVAHAASLGFGGKLCLHPSQVRPVNDAFSPSDEQLRWARETLAAEGDGSVTTRNNQIIGKPLIDRARRVLSREAR